MGRGIINRVFKEERMMLNDKDNNLALDRNITSICSDIIRIVKYSRNLAIKSINIIQLITYYTIGKWIIEEQKKGEERAEYGKRDLLLMKIIIM